ncbi:MAG: TonB-dependent receptor [Bacteroidales bacterium]|nr:TonB-dependent receptor [Bacteroidales bacterium]
MEAFRPINISYTFENNYIVLTKLDENTTGDKSAKRTIVGTVFDDKGEPVSGANVVVKNSQVGVITDANGHYSINARSGEELVVTFIGYLPQNISVGTKTVINIYLQEDSRLLDDVVVIGYGTMKKSDLTSSISSVKGAVINNSSSPNLRDILQGKVPGMDIQSERYEGENRSIYIRGTRSLNASNTPLTIVDGVPASLSDVNTKDIESIEVMKDAASAAIYGSQGANGVIIVTTKRGKSGKTRISFDSSYGINKPMFMDLTSGDKFVQMKRDAYLMANDLWTPGNKGTVDDHILFTDDELKVIASGNYINWYDLVYRDGSVWTNSVSLNGGNEKTKFNLSIRYDDNKGYVKTNRTKSFYTNLSIDHKINKVVSIGATLRYKSRNNSGYATYGQGIFYGTPVCSAYDDDGNIIPIPNINEGAYNILLNYQDGQYENDTKSHNINLLGFLDLKFYKDLRMHTNVGYNISNTRKGYFYGSNSYTSHGLNKSGRSSQHNYQITLNNTLTYEHSFGEHNLTVDFVQEIQKYEYDDMAATGEAEDVEYLKYYNLATNSQNKDIASGYNGWQMASLMGRVRYDYKGKYLFNASVRSDGSSRLAKGHKWSTFFSGGLAWRLSAENFLKDVDWLSNLKLRLSYGEVGNQAIGVYQTIATLGSYSVMFGEDGLYAYRPDRLVNNNLGWEKSKTLNVGLDFGFFRDRLTGSVEYYNTKTSDLLMRRSLPVTVGFSSIFDNVGSTENTGIEVALNANVVRTKDMSLDLYGTMSYNRNKITELVTKDDDISNGWFIGQPISVVYDYQMEGIWQYEEAAEAAKYNRIPGDIKIKDQEGTSEGITADDKVFIGQRDPKVIASFGATFNYKGIDFGIDFQGRFGHLIYHDGYGYNLITAGNRWCCDVDYWTPDNPSNRWPRASQDIADRGLCANFKGDYIKLQNVSIGYDFSQLIKRNTAWKTVSKLRLFCEMRNCAYLYSAAGHGINPESTSVEISVPRSFNFGININF